MSRTYKDSSKSGASKDRRGRRRHLSVRAVRRNPPDYQKLSRAVIELALTEAQAEAAAHQTGRSEQAAEGDTEEPAGE